MANLVFPVRRRDHFMLRDAMFRTRARPSHGGIDLTPVTQNQSESCYAIERGKIIIADNTSGPVGDTSGRDIMILGRDTGIRWWYGHLSSVSVKVGQEVRAGQFIGTTGTTGSNVKGSPSSTGVHLHLEAHYPSINVEIDPWPWIADAPDVEGSRMPLASSRSKARAEYPVYVPPANSGGSTPSSPHTPAPPSKTPEQIEEEEIMSVADKIINTIVDRLVDFIDRRLTLVESRFRREARPEAYFISEGEDGTKYTFEDSPLAILIHPASGFLMPLNVGGHVGQHGSLKMNYRVIGFDSVPQGFPERVFYNTIKDVARGAGIVDRNISEADGIAWAKSLFVTR